jgi:hypothetical protein
VPRGTCYAGTDEVSGILESLGYEWVTGSPLSLVFVRGRTLRASAAADPLDGPLANLTSRKAVGFRITNELSDMTPYDIPRAFARLIDAARNGRRRVFGGIRFRTRFDTGATTWGVALFGDAGMRPGVSSTVQEITDELVDALVDLWHEHRATSAAVCAHCRHALTLSRTDPGRHARARASAPAGVSGRARGGL